MRKALRDNIWGIALTAIAALAVAAVLLVWGLCSCNREPAESVQKAAVRVVWREAGIWSGTDAKLVTKPFEIRGSQWRIRWETKTDEAVYSMPDGANRATEKQFWVRVCAEDGEVVADSPALWYLSSASPMTIDAGPGWFYLEIRTRNIEWFVVAEDTA